MRYPSLFIYLPFPDYSKLDRGLQVLRSLAMQDVVMTKSFCHVLKIDAV